MRIVGGIYQEQCFLPRWDQIFGSAGRAACAISSIFNHRPTLSAWYSKRGAAALTASLAPYGINLDVIFGSSHYVFAYAHPLSVPDCYLSGRPEIKKRRQVKDDVILLFGAVEGYPSILADRLILDPQGNDLFAALDGGLITAKQIAIVANEQEIAMGPGRDTRTNVNWLFRKHPGIAAVIVKRGPFGALAFDRHKVERISAYWSEKVFKIGSGDVFSAVFSFMWGNCGKAVLGAADVASRAVACYVNDPYFNFTTKEIGKAKPFVRRRKVAQIYLAAPFFAVSDFLMLADARRSLTGLGAEIFSPFHHVGYGANTAIAKKDLRALADSRCVMALLHNCDPGTLFELGYARAKEIPVVALGENIKMSDLTMLAGTRCIVESDFCSAAYKAVWTAFGSR